ncbi:hypothetical protein H5410_061935 [Solanum commersonii]|uniref:Uncharacterized protein n=1 Tax=Solanum commersonii TaxID=4109 RepID=A0A9J5W9C6_SOLCO|nr:hypothetical protein H5410_061935 [Solanum commersonii]
MVEIMNDNEEFAVPYKPTPKVENDIENLTNVVGLTKSVHPEAQKMLEKLSLSNTPIITMKGAFEDVWASQREEKMGPIFPCDYKVSVPTSNNQPKIVPWNYKPTVVTYKGNEVNEEVDEVGGMIHSWRYYASIELRKTKRNDKVKIKRPAVKKKLFYYGTEKTPTQISLFSSLIHSNEHRKAIMKILNEAHVPNEVIISQLEKIVGKLFEVNRIIFQMMNFRWKTLDLTKGFILL